MVLLVYRALRAHADQTATWGDAGEGGDGERVRKGVLTSAVRSGTKMSTQGALELAGSTRDAQLSRAMPVRCV